MLERVKDFYQQYAGVEGTVRPHLLRILSSDDPEVREKLFSGEPCCQIELPPEQVPLTREVIEANAEIIEYLRHHSFALEPRLTFVRETVSRLCGQLNRVACRVCPSGWLCLDPEVWKDPSDYCS
jgi:hypothetical protein